MELFCKEQESWESFYWPVTRLPSNLDIPVLRQLAPYINDGHNEITYMETTFFNKLYGMGNSTVCSVEPRDIRRPPKGMGTSKACKGDDAINRLGNVQTSVQMCQTAIRLEMSIIEALEDILNEEKDEIIIKTRVLKCSDFSVAIHENECRVFKSLISSRSSRGCSAFPEEKQ